MTCTSSPRPRRWSAAARPASARDTDGATRPSARESACVSAAAPLSSAARPASRTTAARSAPEKPSRARVAAYRFKVDVAR